ncbi:hypothetical protein ABIB37_002791 [Agrococcus sp. UYP10]|uniref:hypothetical protein n=1 Tax=Agrococcus sp. UYP10 TaxID=1756355 RepID=UPI00339259EA
MLDRDRTLAAELFDESPHLRSTGEVSPKFRALSSRSKRVTVGGQALHVVEGDLLLDDDELILHALRSERADLVPSQTWGDSDLVGILLKGRPVRWDRGTVLRYCVLRNSFPDRDTYRVARESMADAAAAWESVCAIEFTHEVEFDEFTDLAASARDISERLVFVVRFIDAGGEFVASAFFPTQPPARRKVLIDPSFFSDDLNFDRVGIMRHELGHIMGFRHEHILAGAPADCPEEKDQNIFSFGPYDPKSVMHYFCGGVGTLDLTLTPGDIKGAMGLYPRD